MQILGTHFWKHCTIDILPYQREDCGGKFFWDIEKYFQKTIVENQYLHPFPS
jgi:hypothetical protein